MPGRHNLTWTYEIEENIEFISEAMTTMAPSLYALHTIHIKISDVNYIWKQLFMGPWRTLIEAIFSLSALESLELEEAPWFAGDEAFPSFTLRHTNLQRFLYRAPFIWSLEAIRTPEYGRRSTGQLTIETHNLRLLLDANRETLEILELPGELVDGLLDPSFPLLRELSLFRYESERVIHELAPYHHNLSFKSSKSSSLSVVPFLDSHHIAPDASSDSQDAILDAVEPLSRRFFVQYDTARHRTSIADFIS
ncbi:uncharacterized protein BT62DRAFT_1001722 [Guyanagaster necrorhizus]|uniref:Uncharacterized protein n=1 Tax=Guyanagaster necrorhizus TaxID=856835 RepID=A0A9P8AX64_9AGAR|nr:uncharacterized protein BT62DRAFT_1001722 [Guyanagaster necrorhizus MCA 3950]KAG7450876.1 hypothetical protein BT62DRAFT_1001722 [Guyanagaster necrorhizus MCA 3950]